MRRNQIFDEIIKDIIHDYNDIFNDMSFAEFVKLNLSTNNFWLFYAADEMSVDLVNEYFIQYIEEYYDQEILLQNRNRY
jgi:hypothetical protein